MGIVMTGVDPVVLTEYPTTVIPLQAIVRIEGARIVVRDDAI